MNAKRLIAAVGAVAALSAALLPANASAHGPGWYGPPPHGHGWGRGYYARPPAVVFPAPVYAVPPPRYVAAPVYVAPVPAPVFYPPPGNGFTFIWQGGW